MPETVATSHVWADADGRAWIDKTNVKVIEVVLDHLAYGWSPDEIHNQHPHLSLGQIHSAIDYYYDHKPELDEDIERRYQQAEVLRERVGIQLSRSELEARLKERKEEQAHHR